MHRPGEKTLQLRFLRNPVEILAGDLGTAQGLKLEKMRLQEAGGKQVAIPTGSMQEIPVSPLTSLPSSSATMLVQFLAAK